MPYNLRQKSKPVVNMSLIEVEDNTMTLVEELKTVMDTSQYEFGFACGGSLPILHPDMKPSDSDKGVHLDPIALRCDPRDCSIYPCISL